MPTRQLFVLRHAKSSWDDAGLNDHERPLSPRGRRAVKLLREHLQRNRIEAALVLCSTATRTRQTLEGVQPGGKQLVERELYGADASAVIERLRQVPEQVPSVMLIGHNPAMQMVVLRLAADEATTDGSPLAQVRRKFPTGALATLEFDCAWKELGSGRALLSSVVRPKQLSVG